MQINVFPNTERSRSRIYFPEVNKPRNAENGCNKASESILIRICISGGNKKKREKKMAEKGGFEPPRPVLLVCTLSRGVPSATRPLLRTNFTALVSEGLHSIEEI